jgi:hypothetical protein
VTAITYALTLVTKCANFSNHLIGRRSQLQSFPFVQLQFLQEV